MAMLAQIKPMSTPMLDTLLGWDCPNIRVKDKLTVD